MSNMKDISKLPCAAVKDLLPLYCDDVLSSETKEMVSAHLEDCGDCAAEYKSLSEGLPAEDNKVRSTKESFDRTMKRLKIRRAVRLMICAALACVLGYGLFNVPIVKCSDVNAERIYRIERDGEEVFVLIQSYTQYGGDIMFEPIYSEKNGRRTAELAYRVPLISWPLDWDTCGDVWVFTAIGECDEITYGGKVIWTKEAADGNAPEFAYELADAVYDHTGRSSVDLNNGIISLSYGDNGVKRWDFDGNEINLP